MQQYLIRRLILVIPTIWLVISILFLALRALPGDFVTRQLANFENQGVDNKPTEILGRIDAVPPTTHRVVSGNTIDSIAADNDLSVEQLLSNNPDIDASTALRPRAEIVIVPGQLLKQVVIEHKLARNEEDEVLGAVDALIALNPSVDFPLHQGDPFAPAGEPLTLHNGVTVAELAYVNRVGVADYLAANPTMELNGDTVLEHGFAYNSPSRKILEATVQHRLGIDKSLGAQYIQFLWETVRLKFRDSFKTGENSFDIFRRALSPTLHLNLYALIVALLVAIPVGVLSAMRQDRPLDYGLRGFAILALAAPSFWIAMMLMFVVTPGGITNGGLWTIPLTDENARSVFDSFTGAIALYTIPAVAGGIAAGAGLMRITRSELLEVLRQDYVRTAWSKGLRERTVIRRHAMRNALINVVSILGLQIAALVSGNIILEILFNVPGLGFVLVERIRQVDLPVVQTTVLFLALFIIIVNIIVDLSYAVIDPRIRFN